MNTLVVFLPVDFLGYFYPQLPLIITKIYNETSSVL